MQKLHQKMRFATSWVGAACSWLMSLPFQVGYAQPALVFIQHLSLVPFVHNVATILFVCCFIILLSTLILECLLCTVSLWLQTILHLPCFRVFFKVALTPPLPDVEKDAKEALLESTTITSSQWKFTCVSHDHNTLAFWCVNPHLTTCTCRSSIV